MDLKEIQVLYSIKNNKYIIDLCFTTMTNKNFENYLKEIKTSNGGSCESYETLKSKVLYLTEDIEELRTNYWNLRHDVIKKK